MTGHDRPERYVLRLTGTGGLLEHVATIVTPTGGQAIGWDSEPRMLWSINRTTGQVVASRLPAIR